MLYAIIAVLFILADQALKLWTVTHLELNTGIKEFIPGFLQLTYIRNYGAAFGVFEGKAWLRWVLLALLVVFTVFIVLGLRKRFLRTGFARWTGVLLLAGLLGNGIDRAVFGYVVDMFEFTFVHFAIFNLADILVVVFGILFCIAVVTGGLGASDEDDEEDEEEEEYERPRRRRDEEDVAPRRRPQSAQSGEARPRRPQNGEARPRRPQEPRTGEGRPRPQSGEAHPRRPQSGETRPQPQSGEVRPRRPQSDPVRADVTAAPAAREENGAELVRRVRAVSRSEDATVRTAPRPAPEKPAQVVRPRAESAPAAPAPVKAESPAPVKAETPAPVKAETPAPVKAESPAPVKAASAPAKKSSDEFDLDAILSEFK